MRHLGVVALFVVLAGCGAEQSTPDTSDDHPVTSENLDKTELNEELATALISEKMPQDNCYDLSVQARGWRIEGPDKSLVEYVPGREPLPQIFHLRHTAMMTKFNGFEGLIDSGVIKAEHIRDYETKEDGGFGSTRTVKIFVYKLDFSEAARKSPSLRINENQTLSSNGVAIASVCLGSIKVSNVKYVIPNDASFSSANFTWNIEVTDPFVQNLLNSGLWSSLPVMGGTGTASLAKTNVGWEATGVDKRNF